MVRSADMDSMNHVDKPALDAITKHKVVQSPPPIVRHGSAYRGPVRELLQVRVKRSKRVEETSGEDLLEALSLFGSVACALQVGGGAPNINWLCDRYQSLTSGATLRSPHHTTGVEMLPK